MNTDYLKGIACPRCRNTESFRMAVELQVRVNDHGLTTQPHVPLQPHYDDGTPIVCNECGKSGIVAAFRP